MKKLIKYISVVFIFLLFFNTCCLATDINMNLQSNLETNNQANVEANVVDDEDETTSQNQTFQSTPNYTNVSTTTSTAEDGFTVGNIINIFLVVVGIVLILLGLAILIRLKY